VSVCKLVLVLVATFLCSGPLEVVEDIKSIEKALTQTCEVQNAAAAAVTVAIDCLLLRLATVVAVAVVPMELCIVLDFLLEVSFGMLMLAEFISKLYVVKIKSSFVQL
jgi:hypothetical protein